jgi:leader peptidase (prepilin peptidase) / N-methyltransferase
MTPLFSTLLGVCIGSFLNVCLFRWKKRKQIFFPASFCPHCKKPLFWYDNIPLISFVFLCAKCRFCHKSISWQYPIVEFVTGGLFLISFFDYSNDLYRLVMSFFFVSCMVLLVISDLKWRLLPHPFNNFFILVGLAFSGNGAFLSSANYFKAVSGFFLIGSLMFGINYFYPNGLGGGDIKLAAALIIWFGFTKVVYVLLIAFGVGALVYGILFLLNKVTRKSMVPFGPFLALGAFIIWFFPGILIRMGLTI